MRRNLSRSAGVKYVDGVNAWPTMVRLNSSASDKPVTEYKQYPWQSTCPQVNSLGFTLGLGQGSELGLGLWSEVSFVDELTWRQVDSKSTQVIRVYLCRDSKTSPKNSAPHFARFGQKLRFFARTTSIIKNGQCTYQSATNHFRRYNPSRNPENPEIIIHYNPEINRIFQSGKINHVRSHGIQSSVALFNITTWPASMKTNVISSFLRNECICIRLWAMLSLKNIAVSQTANFKR